MGKTKNSKLGFGTKIVKRQNIYSIQNDKKSHKKIKLKTKDFPYSKSKDKYDHYLFNFKNKKSEPKANYLSKLLGYKIGDGKILHKEIFISIKDKKPDHNKTEYGEVLIYNTNIRYKDNKNKSANVRIVLQKDNKSNVWRLITLHPIDKGEIK